MEIKIKKILIDFGIGFTKVGFIGESEPIKIIPTPSLLNLEDYFQVNTDKINILSFSNISLEKKLELEEFSSYIINNILQIYKSEAKYTYYCYILFDLDLKESFIDIFTSFIKYIYEAFSFISSIKIIPKKIFPIFVSGFYSGILLNCGYTFSTITVVNNGLCVFSKKVFGGSCDMQKALYSIIINDVKNRKNGNQLNENEFEILKKNLVKYIDDIMVRISYILNRKVSQEYKQINSGEENKEKEQHIKIGFYTDLPLFKIDFNTRVILGEKLFDENNENNLAFLILKTLNENVPCEIRKKIGSNIILSGGLTMLEGFYQRFLDEINFIADNNKEFVRLKGIRNDLRVHKIIYPRNILTWVGASLFFGNNKINFPGNEINREIKENKLDKKIDNDELKRIFDNLRI